MNERWALLAAASILAGCQPPTSQVAPEPAAPVAAVISEPEQPYDVVALVKRAKRDIGAGRHEQAMRHLLWAFDYGPSLDQPSVGVVATTVPQILALLGAKYPPALRALRARKARIEVALRAGRSVSIEYVMLYEGASRALGRVADCVQTCVMLSREALAAPQREVLCGLVVDELLDAEMWKEAVEDAPNIFPRSFERSIEHRYPGVARSISPTPKRAGRLFGAMLRLGKLPEASTFAKRVVDELAIATACMELMRAARAAGHADLAAEIRRRAVAKLDSHQREMLEQIDAANPQVLRERGE